MESAAERKQRLKRLREEAKESQPQNTSSETKKRQPTLKFRNYQIDSETITHEKIEPAKAPSIQPKKQDEEETIDDDQNVVNVAPKKANWDLKRDVQKQLQILERRTNRALAQLLLEQLKQEQYEQQQQQEKVEDE
eukprot:TRINITY_DN6972_c1_g1_i1.p3 TRINITY_DN6972_c1_g1~~TRINITY_DN6972_c1_g1_i1.p3  ORF type:complete len:136 (-),score=19.69 TRINITY_DN6972_c1_g1_i1:661-1068(-)